MHTTTDTQTHDTAALLENFISGDRQQAAFGVLVERVGGLVYPSALRRTRDRQLAEEVTQNVFAIMARKAASLRRHPALTAWIFQTTRYEASKAMRSERRRQKKHDALARDAIASTLPSRSPEDEAAWREAVPLLDESLDHLPEKDRQIVLQRFFEERKFSEIAQKTGRSEAACKMQLKRALKKLSSFLTARGVTLSGTALASGLAVEFARSAHAQAVASIAPQALAFSGKIGAASLVTNTIQTMSTIKTITVTSAAVVAVASAPFFWQQSKANSLNSELGELEARRLALEIKVREARPAAGEREDLDAIGGGLPRTVKELLAAADGPVDVDALFKSMMEVMATQDIIGMIRVFAPLSNLSPEEFRRVFDEIEGREGNSQMKQMALELLGSFAPDSDPSETLERMLKLGVEPHNYANLVADWGARDPDAAIAWFEGKLDAGELAAKGVSRRSPGQTLLAELVAGIATTRPGRAIELYEEYRGAETGAYLVSSLAASLGAVVKKTGDDSHLRQLLELHEERERPQIVNHAIRRAVQRGDYDAGLAFAGQLLGDPDLRRQAVVAMLADHRPATVAERGDWLLANTTAEETPLAVGGLATLLAPDFPQPLAEWLNAQPPGAARDHGLRSLSISRTQFGNFEEALRRAEEIHDVELRSEALDQLASRWMSSKPEAARNSLPAEFAEKYGRK